MTNSYRNSGAVLILALLVTFAGGLTSPPTVDATQAPSTAITVDLPPHDATIGTLGGEAMAQGGAASYTIPIVVPPGRNGRASH